MDARNWGRWKVRGLVSRRDSPHGALRLAAHLVFRGSVAGFAGSRNVLEESPGQSRNYFEVCGTTSPPNRPPPRLPGKRPKHFFFCLSTSYFLRPVCQKASSLVWRVSRVAVTTWKVVPSGWSSSSRIAKPKVR